MKVTKADLRRQTSHEPSSLVTKDSPDDFEYEGANVSPDRAATITSSQTAPASASTSADGPKATKQPYVKVDNPDDFE